MAESVAEIRTHCDGLVKFALDLNVINVTKDAIWVCQAVDFDGAAPALINPRRFVKPGEKLPETIDFPTQRNPLENQQEQFVHNLEIDAEMFYPDHAFHKPTQTWPGVTNNPREMLKARGIEVDKE
jgi:hypothetical protein